MDLYTTKELKCEPEVVVKLEPVFTESGYDVITVKNENFVNTECEPVSFSSSNCRSLNDDVIKQECKCSFCMRNQVAAFLPTANISTSVNQAVKEEDPLAASEHNQENTDNLMSIKDSAGCIQTRNPKTEMKSRHYCPYCSRNFTRRASFSIHLLKKHSKNNTDSLVEKFDKPKSPCSRCLKSHMRMHDKFVDNNKFKCNNCDYESSQLCHLPVHMQEKYSKGKQTCRFCNKTLCNKMSLGDHLLTFHGEYFDKSLKTICSRIIKHCSLCDFRAISKSLLDGHLRRKHSNDVPTHACRFCDTTLLSKSCLADHLLFHHGDKLDKSLKKLLSLTIKHCNLCDFRIYTKDKLIAHIQRMHSNKRPTFSCRFCNKTLSRNETLANHLLCHHGDKFEKSLKTLLSRTIKHCKLCDFRVVNKAKLDQHMTKHSDSPVTEMFKCNNCVYETCNKSDLRVHIQRMHSNDRPTYSCRFCNKTLSRKESLANHLLVHHGDKFDKSLKTLLSLTIKQCKLCDFRTIIKETLNQHIATHGE